MKCIKCFDEGVKENGMQVGIATVVYHGFSLCEYHFTKWHDMVKAEVNNAKSNIIKPPSMG